VALAEGRGRRRARVLAAAVAAVAMAAASGGSIAPSSASPRTAEETRTHALDVASCLTRSTCDTPRRFRVAYGIEPLVEHGIDGRGQTVVLLELAAPPSKPPTTTDIRQDLERFDRMFDLPAARLGVVDSLARSPDPWGANLEEVEDTEIVHAVAPEAAIREVLVSDAALGSAADQSSDVAAALVLGLRLGSVISLSKSTGEECFTPGEVARLHAALHAAALAKVTVVNSSGDSGAAGKPCPGAQPTSPMVKAVNLLDSDPLTLAVGGTDLRTDPKTGAYAGETAWSVPTGEPLPEAPVGSGGGFSRLFRRPAYQDGVPGIGATRGVPDVAADADADGGMALVVGDGRSDFLTGAGGTSAAAPLWAAVIALADEDAGRHLGFVNPAIYRIGRSAAYHRAFHDVTTGTNTVRSSSQTVTGYDAGPGWDPVTGWGSPNAAVLVPLLAKGGGR